MSAPSPIPFQLVAGGVLVALVYHLLRVYGARRAASLLGPFLLIALTKELATRTPPYRVLIEGVLPGPVIVASGWTVIYLLGLETGRLIGARLGGTVARRLLFRLMVIGLFAAFASHGIEPIGQFAGWWHWWQREDFPEMADGDWFGVVSFMSMWALLFTAGRRKQVVGELAVLFVATLGTAAAVAKLVSPGWGLTVFVLIPLLSPRPLLDETIVASSTHLRPVEAAIPPLSITAIALTLVAYASVVEDPRAIDYVWRPLGLGVLLTTLTWLARVAPPAERRPSSGALAATADA